jgi:hypothetical protein
MFLCFRQEIDSSSNPYGLYSGAFHIQFGPGYRITRGSSWFSSERARTASVPSMWRYIGWSTDSSSSNSQTGTELRKCGIMCTFFAILRTSLGHDFVNCGSWLHEASKRAGLGGRWVLKIIWNTGKLVRFNIGASGKQTCSWRIFSRLRTDSI